MSTAFVTRAAAGWCRVWDTVWPVPAASNSHLQVRRVKAGKDSAAWLVHSNAWAMSVAGRLPTRYPPEP